MIVEQYQIITICAWCGVHTGNKPTCNAAQHGTISHGACSDCAAKTLAEFLKCDVATAKVLLAKKAA